MSMALKSYDMQQHVCLVNAPEQLEVISKPHINLAVWQPCGR